MSVPSHVPEQTTVHGPESAGSPVVWPANALAKGIDTSECEVSAPESCSYDFQFIAMRLATLAAQPQQRATPKPLAP
jgi:hypothetical protein